MKGEKKGKFALFSILLLVRVGLGPGGENLKIQTSRVGSRNLSGSGKSSPAHHPLGTAHRRSSTLGRYGPTANIITVFSNSVSNTWAALSEELKDILDIVPK